MPSEPAASNPEPHAAAARWLRRFDEALARGDGGAAAALFLPDGHWRDVLAFTWHVRTVSGADAIEAMLEETLDDVAPRDFRIAPDRTPPRWVTRAGTRTVEAIVRFETAVGCALGVLRLVPDPAGGDEFRAWILLTSLDAIRGHEERIGDRRTGGEAFTREFGGDNWLDLRAKARAYSDRDPAVVVVGAGQAGLAIAARLGALGVDTLVVERNARIGDNWRDRYHSLTLHNEVHVNHFPYMPFPPTFPVYIPKDKLANWFETYAETLDLDVWTGTELVAGDYDERAGRWTITVRRGDGGERELRPRHLVFAVGVSTIPIRPDLPGLDAFAGTVVHSGDYTTGHEWAGRDVLVLGTGNSGHDVAQDLHASGARVTMIQRSSTNIVSLKEAQKVYAVYAEGIAFEDCDLLATSLPYPVLVRAFQLLTEQMRDNDRPLLDALAARGFRLDFGDDGTGFQMKYLRRGGGYYFDVGCCGLVASGEIGLVHFRDIDRFVAEGARMRDGTVVPADLLVTATGFLNQRDVVRVHLGDAIADRIGPVWGFDAGGELRNMWRRTPQPGLWFTAGSLAQSRIYSRFLAMQIKACEEGLIEPALPAAAHPAPTPEPAEA